MRVPWVRSVNRRRGASSRPGSTSLSSSPKASPGCARVSPGPAGPPSMTFAGGLAMIGPAHVPRTNDSPTKEAAWLKNSSRPLTSSPMRRQASGWPLTGSGPITSSTTGGSSGTRTRCGRGSRSPGPPHRRLRFRGLARWGPRLFPSRDSLAVLAVLAARAFEAAGIPAGEEAGAQDRGQRRELPPQRRPETREKAEGGMIASRRGRPVAPRAPRRPRCEKPPRTPLLTQPLT